MGLDGRYVYYSDVVPGGGEPQKDHSFEVAPRFEVGHRDGAGRYRLGYSGNYQGFRNRSDFNALEHRVRLRMRRRLSSRTRVEIDERFRDISNLRFSLADLESGDTAFSPEQQRYLANDVIAGIEHALTERLFVRAEISHQLVNFLETEDRNDSQALVGDLELSYQLSPTRRAGVEVSAGTQSFQPTASRLGSDAGVYGLNLVFEQRLDETSTISVRWGPALVRSRDRAIDAVSVTSFLRRDVEGQPFRVALDACRIDPSLGVRVESGCRPVGGTNDLIPTASLGPIERFTLPRSFDTPRRETLSHFGDLQYEGKFGDWAIEAGYERRLSNTTGDALASSLDRFSAAMDYVPEALAWRWYAAGRVDRRRSLTPASVVDFVLEPGPDGAAQRQRLIIDETDGEDRLRNLTIVTGLAYHFDRRLMGGVEFRYLDTRSADAFGTSRQPGRYLFQFTLSYDFDPRRL